MFLLYNVLVTFLAPLWVPWMLIRTWRRREQPNWKQRMGDYRAIPPRRESGPRIWVHAVSVGEVVAARPLLREIRRRLPEHEILLSVTTSSGHQTASQQPDLYNYLTYVPLDIPRFVLTAMQRVRPDALLIMETELWMDLLWAARVFDAKTFLINGRISDRSFPRSQRIAFFYRALLAQVDRCLVQTPTDAERIRALGAPSVDVLGNLKFDEAMPEPTAVDWRTELGLNPERPVVVVGSLRREEFATVCPALRQLATEAQVVVAPRHIEMVDELAAALGGDPPRRSRGQQLADGLYILDSYGELASVYQAADVVVVGGGFANLGGQNIIQPMGHGKTVVFGSHMQNFRDVAALAVSAGAGFSVEADVLLTTVRRLLDDADRRREMGDAARRLTASHCGAAARYVAAVAEAIGR